MILELSVEDGEKIPVSRDFCNNFSFLRNLISDLAAIKDPICLPSFFTAKLIDHLHGILVIPHLTVCNIFSFSRFPLLFARDGLTPLDFEEIVHLLKAVDYLGNRDWEIRLYLVIGSILNESSEDIHFSALEVLEPVHIDEICQYINKESVLFKLAKMPKFSETNLRFLKRLSMNESFPWSLFEKSKRDDLPWATMMLSKILPSSLSFSQRLAAFHALPFFSLIAVDSISDVRYLPPGISDNICMKIYSADDYPMEFVKRTAKILKVRKGSSLPSDSSFSKLQCIHHVREFEIDGLASEDDFRIFSEYMKGPLKYFIYDLESKRPYHGDIMPGAWSSEKLWEDWHLIRESVTYSVIYKSRIVFIRKNI